MPHLTEIKVRGYHLDVYGHVNNARYLEFLEEARWAFFEQETDLADFARRNYGFAIVNININYRRPAFMGEVLQISSYTKAVGNRSMTVHQDVTLKEDGAAVADADVTFVLIDLKTQKAVAIDPDLRAVFESMVVE